MVDISKRMMNTVVSLIFIAILLPIGLVYIINIGSTVVVYNGANTTLNSIAGATIIVQLLSTLIPLAIGISVITYFMRKDK